ncbi:MAG: hypothetical protein MOIL_01429 [Candidatus Methanolliviera sp. GoM_oil]|nr:MAG: hypothetical protein MOIL_01429 [Candidatus Methanolliviera sp. GoM_oil]
MDERGIRKCSLWRTARISVRKCSYPERPPEMDSRDELRMLEEDERALGDDLERIRGRIREIKEEIERRR